MIDNPFLITAAYAAGAAALSFGIAKLSPGIKRKWRHPFAGIAPLGAVYAAIIVRDDVVVLDGGDLMFSGLLVATGIAASLVATGRLTAEERALLSR